MPPSFEALTELNALSLGAPPLPLPPRSSPKSTSAMSAARSFALLVFVALALVSAVESRRTLRSDAAANAIVASPRPYTAGVFDGKVVPVPQGPLGQGDVKAVDCDWFEPGKTVVGVPGNWLNALLDTAINQPVCRRQRAQATIGGRR